MPLHRQYLYNLETETETILDDIKGIPSRVRLIENILIDGGYDIEQGVYFRLRPYDLPEVHKRGRTWISNDMLIWLNTPYGSPLAPYDGPKRLLTTQLVRE